MWSLKQHVRAHLRGCQTHSLSGLSLQPRSLRICIFTRAFEKHLPGKPEELCSGSPRCSSSGDCILPESLHWRRGAAPTTRATPARSCRWEALGESRDFCNGSRGRDVRCSAVRGAGGREKRSPCSPVSLRWPVTALAHSVVEVVRQLRFHKQQPLPQLPGALSHPARNGSTQVESPPGRRCVFTEKRGRRAPPPVVPPRRPACRGDLPVQLNVTECDLGPHCRETSGPFEP